MYKKNRSQKKGKKRKKKRQKIMCNLVQIISWRKAK